jgi:lipid II:glycine glycyltransferase (peptidoglycan interpeptide bridge formation enzyme)
MEEVMIRSISAAEYENWIDSIEEKSFIQSSYQGIRMSADNWDVSFLAYLEHDEIAACAMLCMRPLMKVFRFAYIPGGILTKRKDQALYQSFFQELKEDLKKKKVVFLKTDPYAVYQNRDQNGDVLSTDDSIIKIYQACGFEHEPMTAGYDLKNQVRWMSILELEGKNEDQIFKEMEAQTRRNIKNALKYCVRVRKLAREELGILQDMVQKSADRHHFSIFSLHYYEEMYDIFKDHAQAYYAYLDLNDYQNDLQKQKEEEERVIAEAQKSLASNPNSKNSKNRLKVAQSHLESLENRIQEARDLKSQYGDEIGLAASMFVFYGQEVVYLMSGSDDRFKRFHGPYALQWFSIRKAIQEGYKKYNFYGISGLFNPEDEGYGVFSFKRGFNAHVVELVGSFDLPLHPALYKVYKKKNGL